MTVLMQVDGQADKKNIDTEKRNSSSAPEFITTKNPVTFLSQGFIVARPAEIESTTS